MPHRPDFLLIGAAKSGTSALYSQLAGHPEIFMSPVKEPNHFALRGRPATFRAPGDVDTINRRSVSSRQEYLRLFEEAGDARAVGEASTLYLYSPVAAEEIRRFDPTMKILVMLRDPVERALSSYRHVVRDGWEKLSFGEGLDREPDRIAAGWSHIWHYAEAGRYADQMARYTDLFPSDQIGVFVYERFRREPEAVLREVFRFLGVDPDHRVDTARRYNVSGQPRFKLLHRLVIGDNALKRTLRPLVPRRLRGRVVSFTQSWNVKPGAATLERRLEERLEQRFGADVAALEARLGLDLCDWKRSGRRGGVTGGAGD